MKNKSLYIVSAFIIISDLLFIMINYQATLNTLNSDTRRWANEVNHVFALTLNAKSTSMQQLASFVANLPQVQGLFYRAKFAHENVLTREDEFHLSTIRSQLLDYVSPSWKVLTKQYDVRQLHFHFGPGSTSFLRVHRPDKHSDNMDQVRFTVVDVNRLHAPVKGFETGRVYSGIRGVVPVTFHDSKRRSIHVGALEAGTSFTNMLRTLSTELDSNIAVLLTKNHIHENMWPDFIKNHFSENRVVGNFFIESTTTPDSQNFLSQKRIIKLISSGEGATFITGDSPKQVSVFPLRDYRGKTKQDLPHSGVIIVWKNATDKWDLLRSNLQNNIAYALIALVVIEFALIVGWKLSQRHLKRIIQRQTRKLEKLARQDGLTGLFNRGTIEKYLEEETSRARRHSSSFSVLMFDVDHFKKVNDTYGHNAGDEVLKNISSCAAGHIRNSDKIGRWGGEEFLVLVLEASLEEVSILADRI